MKKRKPSKRKPSKRERLSLDPVHGTKAALRLLAKRWGLSVTKVVEYLTREAIQSVKRTVVKEQAAKAGRVGVYGVNHWDVQRARFPVTAVRVRKADVEARKKDCQ